MIEEEAVVVGLEGERIWVEKAESSGCGSCRQACASAVVAEHVGKRPIRLAVVSPIALQTGDRVVVGVPEDAVVVGSLVLYLVPLLGLLAGSILGKVLGASLLPGFADPAAILGGLAGFAGTLVWLRTTPALSDRAPQPVVLRKLG